jgi:hypothetical protein
MKFPTRLFIVSLLVSSPLAPAQTLPRIPYEAPSALQASDLFPAVLLTGAHYRVRTAVESVGGLNYFTIDSDEGVFTASGNEMLIERLREINAIHQLRQISKSEEYKTSLKAAANAPLDLAKSLVNQPKETVQGVAKGAWKLMHRAGESVKDAVNGRERSAYEESAGRDLIGFTKVKRELAVSLGVNPYSQNPTLQKVLDEVAWTSYGGKMTFAAALLPLGGTAATIATGMQVSTSLRETIRDNGPEDLRILNNQILTSLGLPPVLIQNFLSNTAFSPVHQTMLTEALKGLRGVEGLDVLLDLTRSAADEDDAYFFQRTTELIAWLHTGTTPISRIVSLNGFPVCLARDGKVVVALHLDYASWSPVTDRFVNALLRPQSLTPTGFRVVLSGTVSPVLRQQLEAAGVLITDRLSAVNIR